MPIKTIIMPDFLILFILEPCFKFLK
jgi:hypothetical protein